MAGDSTTYDPTKATVASRTEMDESVSRLETARVTIGNTMRFESPSIVFSTALIDNLRINGVDCIIAACNTAETNNMQGSHNSAVGIIHNPSWLFNACYKYKGLALLNFQGLTDPQYAKSAQSIGYLQDLLDQYCTNVGIHDWRQRYG